MSLPGREREGDRPCREKLGDEGFMLHQVSFQESSFSSELLVLSSPLWGLHCWHQRSLGLFISIIGLNGKKTLHIIVYRNIEKFFP